MSSNTLPVCPKTGSTSPSLTVHLCLHTALLREIGNAPEKTEYRIEIRARNGQRPSGAGAEAGVTTKTLAIPRPTITQIQVTSDPNDDQRPGDDDTYAIGDTVEVELTFSEEIDATGSPKIQLELNQRLRTGECAATTGSLTLACEYTVATEDEAPEARSASPRR